MDDTTTPPCSAPASVSVVGAGRLGTAIAAALRHAAVAVNGPSGRGDAIAAADVVLICVPDAAIGDAAAAAAGKGAFIGHTSGATPLATLSPFGGERFGLHPLQTFAGGEDHRHFDGIGCAVAGETPAAIATARSLATALGALPFEIADGDRAAYHAAASIASNFLVTLEAVAEQVAAGAGLEPDAARALLAPLVRSTVENWASDGPQRALTGPVARGDDATVARQREAVSATSPELLDLFDLLCAHTRDLAAVRL